MTTTNGSDNPILEALTEVNAKLTAAKENLRIAELSVRPLKAEIEKWEAVITKLMEAARIADQVPTDRHPVKDRKKRVLSINYLDGIISAVSDGCDSPLLYKRLRETYPGVPSSSLYNAIYMAKKRGAIESADGLFFPAKKGVQ